MVYEREDQAAGLRRLFRRTPPRVVALYTAGRQRAHIAVRAAHSIARQSERVLLIDEAVGEDALTEALELPSGHDLLKILDGQITLAELLQPVPGLMGRVPASAAALVLPLLDDERRACIVEGLRRLYRHAGFVLINASFSSSKVPSPFVYASPRRLLVAEVSASGATEAYRLIKNLARSGIGSLHVSTVGARDRKEASAFFATLDELVRRYVGMPLAWLGEVERDNLAGALGDKCMLSSPRESEMSFIYQLKLLSTQRSLECGQ